VAQAEGKQICADWLSCLADETDKFAVDLLLTLNELKFSFNQGGHDTLLQHSSGEDIHGCAHPSVINASLLECSCLDVVRVKCEKDAQGMLREGNVLYECVRLEMCKAPPAEICQSWKASQCSDDEMNPTLLEVQGTQKGERAVLLDVFQGRRQMPENTSELRAAALEESLSGKCASKTNR